MNIDKLLDSISISELESYFENEEDEEEGSSLEVIFGSCAELNVDVVVNAANKNLLAGGGICGVIYEMAGRKELSEACGKIKSPLEDGQAVITPSFAMGNAKAIIHAVGPNFSVTPDAVDKLFDAYYNSLKLMMDSDYHSISFPLISAGIYGGSLQKPGFVSTIQCCKAYDQFTEDYPEYLIDVKLCAFTEKEFAQAMEALSEYFAE